MGCISCFPIVYHVKWIKHSGFQHPVYLHEENLKSFKPFSFLSLSGFSPAYSIPVTHLLFSWLLHSVCTGCPALHGIWQSESIWTWTYPPWAFHHWPQNLFKSLWTVPFLWGAHWSAAENCAPPNLQCHQLTYCTLFLLWVMHHLLCILKSKYKFQGGGSVPVVDILSPKPVHGTQWHLINIWWIQEWLGAPGAAVPPTWILTKLAAYTENRSFPKYSTLCFQNCFNVGQGVSNRRDLPLIQDLGSDCGHLR